MGFDYQKLIAGLGALVALSGVAVAQTCQNERLDLRGDWGQAQFSIEIADDVDERAQGLMFREAMGRMAGMLFIYETPGPVSFWMKNTILPLDMIFVDPSGIVTAIHENAIPGDTTPIPGGENVLLVFEVNAGIVEMFGITTGSTLRHPRIDQNTAAWPCDVQ